MELFSLNGEWSMRAVDEAKLHSCVYENTVLYQAKVCSFRPGNIRKRHVFNACADIVFLWAMLYNLF